MIKVGSDFSGVGAFDQALRRLNIDYKTVFACDMDLYARESYMANYGEPIYYPFDVYEREIPKESLDIYMTSPPCQAFSLAGNRKGEDDKRGVLFYNSHEFIMKNKPRYFIFENVKGLLSDAKGRTFQIWLDMLGGKSINGNPVIFPREDATPYHIYYKVLNAKNYGVPQNRERVFIVGIRDDADNNFNWPKKQQLTKRLKDVLEVDVDKKFYLSDLAIERLCNNDSGFTSDPKEADDIASTICASDYKIARGMNVLKVKSATKKGYEVATENDSINLSNLSNLSSETRRGRVGKEVAQTLDTACNQAVVQVVAFGRSETEKQRRKEHFQKTGKDSGSFKDKELIVKDQDYYDTLLANPNPQKEGLIATKVDAKPLYKGVAVHPLSKKLEFNGFKDSNCPTLLATDYKAPKCVTFSDYQIRRLTPRECFRLMDFPDSFKFVCSNTQLYKQAGNSIVVNVLAEIIKKLKF